MEFSGFGAGCGDDGALWVYELFAAGAIAGSRHCARESGTGEALGDARSADWSVVRRAEEAGIFCAGFGAAGFGFVTG